MAEWPNGRMAEWPNGRIKKLCPLVSPEPHLPRTPSVKCDVKTGFLAEDSLNSRLINLKLISFIRVRLWETKFNL